jgi:tetratricopeptide (TPR) repeat protein
MERENFTRDQLRITKLLAKACLDSHRFERTIDYINESEKLCGDQGTEGENVNDFAEVLTSKARFHYMQHELEKSYDIYLKVWEMYERQNGPACDGCIQAWIEIIKIDQETQQFDVANDNIMECIDQFKKIEFDNSKYTKDTLIDLYMQRIDILGNLKNLNADPGLQIDDGERFRTDERHDQDILKCLLSVRNVTNELQQLNDSMDPKPVLRALKKLMLHQSKKYLYEDALDTVKEIEEIQLKYYGDKSKDIARTWTLKASILFRMEHVSRARDFMRKAVGVYEELGDKKGVIQVKERLRLLEDNLMSD